MKIATQPPTEKEHVGLIGEGPVARAFGLAMLEIKQDRRFVGMDKIREHLAREAALAATGFPRRPLKLPKRCGSVSHDVQTACEEILERAIAKAENRP